MNILFVALITGMCFCAVGLYCLGKWWFYRRSTKPSQPEGSLGLNRRILQGQEITEQYRAQELPAWLAAQSRYGWSAVICLIASGVVVAGGKILATFVNQ